MSKIGQPALEGWLLEEVDLWRRKPIPQHFLKEVGQWRHKPSNRERDISWAVCPVSLKFPLYLYVDWIYSYQTFFGHDTGALTGDEMKNCLTEIAFYELYL